MCKRLCRLLPFFVLLFFLNTSPVFAGEEESSLGFNTERVLSLQEDLTSRLPEVAITPDLPFYYLKIGKEKLLQILHRKADEEISYRLGLAETRLAEAVVMLDEQKYELADRALLAYEEEVDHVQEELDSIDLSVVEKEPLVSRAVESLYTYKAVLDEMERKNVEDAQEKKQVEVTVERGERVGLRYLRSFFSTTISSEDEAEGSFVSPLR